MPDLFERWRALRDEKNDVNEDLGSLLCWDILEEDEALEEEDLVKRYNELYAQMDALQELFTEEDWEAYDADQDEIRQGERQAWLIENRYGEADPPSGIADWWTS